LRERWFTQLLQQAAKLRCVSSRGRTNPRMVKRRHSPYASHDRSRRQSAQKDFTPRLLAPLPLSPRQRFADLANIF
jgi:hypothetical protein